MGVESGADVMSTNGKTTCSGAGVALQAEIRIARKAVSVKRMWVRISDYGNAVGLGVLVGTGVEVGIVVGEGGMDVSLGMTVAVNGRAVCVNGSVGIGVTVEPGSGVGTGVRVATLGTHRVSLM